MTALALGAAGCGTVEAGVVADPGGSADGAPAASGTGASTSSSALAPDASAQPSGAHVPGLGFGEIPPVPLFELPDLTMLDASLSGFATAANTTLAGLPGVRVSTASCDASGKVINGGSALRLYGDGSGNYVGPDGRMTNYGDGSGSYTINGTKVTVYGDGSGNYRKGAVEVISYGDGSGSYTDGRVRVRLYGDGSGNYTAGTEKIVNYGDGSGSYTTGSVTITNYGDGSGAYESPALTIRNYGDGTGQVNGVPAKLEPIAEVPELGHFPKMGTIRPIKACATRISLRDDVLFDFDSSELRPEAGPVLRKVVSMFAAGKVPAAEIEGHTDAKGDDAYNRSLSERRAASVVAALTADGATATLTAQGFGEQRPVAPNTLDGKDYPAGRQLNRRVDIVIPTVGAGS